MLFRFGGYERWRDASDALFSGLSADERARIDGLNAASFYGISGTSHD